MPDTRSDMYTRVVKKSLRHDSDARSAFSFQRRNAASAAMAAAICSYRSCSRRLSNFRGSIDGVLINDDFRRGPAPKRYQARIFRPASIDRARASLRITRIITARRSALSDHCSSVIFLIATVSAATSVCLLVTPRCFGVCVCARSHQ